MNILKIILLMTLLSLAACGGGGSSSGGMMTSAALSVNGNTAANALAPQCLSTSPRGDGFKTVTNSCNFTINFRFFNNSGVGGSQLTAGASIATESANQLFACEAPFVPTNSANGVVCRS